MVKRICLIVVLGLPVLFGARMASADGTAMVLWDRHVARSMNEALLSDDNCRYGPYRLYRQTCVGNELNISLERQERYDTLLDEVAVMVHRYRDLNLKRDIRPGTRIRFKARLSNIYKQEADIRLSLRVQF